MNFCVLEWQLCTKTVTFNRNIHINHPFCFCNVYFITTFFHIGWFWSNKSRYQYICDRATQILIFKLPWQPHAGSIVQASGRRTSSWGLLNRCSARWTMICSRVPKQGQYLWSFITHFSKANVLWNNLTLKWSVFLAHIYMEIWGSLYLTIIHINLTTYLNVFADITALILCQWSVSNFEHIAGRSSHKLMLVRTCKTLLDVEGQTGILPFKKMRTGTHQMSCVTI